MTSMTVLATNTRRAQVFLDISDDSRPAGLHHLLVYRQSVQAPHGDLGD